MADPPNGPDLLAAELARWAAGTELDARDLADRSQLRPRVRRHAPLGQVVLHAGLPREGGRQRWQSAAERFFDRADVLLTPMLARPPLRARTWGERGWLANVAANAWYAPFAAPWNVAGWPAMAVPAGVGATGTPVAVQLVGRPGGEATLLAVAAQLESARPWRRVAPGYGD